MDLCRYSGVAYRHLGEGCIRGSEGHRGSSQEARRGELKRGERPERSPSAITPGVVQSQSKYRTYKRITLLLVVVGALAMAFNPALGLLVIVNSGLSFAVLRAVEIFEGPVDS
jgi:hypothetical protein